MTQLIEWTEEPEDSETEKGLEPWNQFFPPGVGQVVGSLTQLLMPGGSPAQQEEFSVQEGGKRPGQVSISEGVTE